MGHRMVPKTEQFDSAYYQRFYFDPHRGDQPCRDERAGG
jgi:hypothetical protein